MTLYFKFKSGKRAEITAVDDVDHDGDYIYVYMENNGLFTPIMNNL